MEVLDRRGTRVTLLRTPFFSPMSPPLGLAMLHSYLRRHGHDVACEDFNVDPDLWDTQRRYFAALEAADEEQSHDGQSKLWAVINAHMLAVAAGADAAACMRTVSRVAPLYGLRIHPDTVPRLHSLAMAFFDRLGERLAAVDLTGRAFVGASTYTTSLASSLFALRVLKQRFPHVRTIIGGGVFADDLALGSLNLETLLAECDFIDHVVIGEGEELLLRLVEGELADKRLITLDDVGGSVDIATLPAPDFSAFDMTSYFQLSIEGGRSCPFQCSFCSETLQWGRYRKKPAERLAEQAIDLAELHANPRFFLGDSLINPYINGLSAELNRRNRPLLFDGYLRADKPVGNHERVAAWARSGLYRARLGLETAAPHLLEIMSKHTTPQSMIDALRSLTANGVRATTYWVVGHPGETESDFEETLAFVREAHPFIYELEAHPFTYYPYGQVASRLYESESIYPDDVTEVIRFRTWDVVDPQPARAERFARLGRLAALARSLDIPNIYTMAERYEAEDRWQRLSPAAVEVY